MKKSEMVKNGTFVECYTAQHYGALLVTFSDGKDILFQVDTDIESVQDNIIEYRGKEYILFDYYELAE